MTPTHAAPDGFGRLAQPVRAGGTPLRALLLRSLAPALLCILLGVPAAAQVSHPLDPMTWQEHWTLLEVLRETGHYNDSTVVPLVALHEPAKSLVWGWKPGQPIPRAAHIVLKQQARTFEAVVDLSGRRLVSHREVPGVQPNWLRGEFTAMESDVKKHPEFIAAMGRRGITDFTFIDCGAGPPGYFGLPEEEGRRVAYGSCQDARQVRNTWTRQIEGLVFVYDMNERRVMRVIDDGVIPVPRTVADYDEASLGTPWSPLPPITITRPAGHGFQLDGHEVTWQNWSFHVRPDQRAGMIVSTVRYRDGDRPRQVMYQGNISEIFVPYMDPATSWYHRNFLDIGEYVSGGLAKSMEPGVDCPADAAWFSQIVVEDNGRPRSVPRVICLFERVSGDMVWRHRDASGVEGRPKRDLVVRMAAVLGNYDYIIDWVFQHDGTIRVLVGATGITEVKMVRERDAIAALAAVAQAGTGSGTNGGTAAAAPKARADAYGRYVAENVVAVNHDHYFNFRLDLDVDGPVNSFQRDRLVTERLPEAHPRRSVWVVVEETLAREHDARLDMDMHRPALWRVVSNGARNHVGYTTSYQLAPGHNVHTLLSADDYPRRRAGFIDYHLWVTPYSADEQFAAGMYPTLSKPGEGLPQWTSGNRGIEDRDIVLWYTMGMYHVTRAEDWPVMPVAWHSFELRPFDFFNGNPAMRLPRVP
jgi:primary-amine oxidase